MEAGLQGGLHPRNQLNLFLPAGMVVVADQVTVSIEEKGRMAGHQASQTNPPTIAREWKGGLTEGAGGVEPTLIQA
jgi:hypothetical protein